jgi:hypothetical protein
LFQLFNELTALQGAPIDLIRHQRYLHRLIAALGDRLDDAKRSLGGFDIQS